MGDAAANNGSFGSNMPMHGAASTKVLEGMERGERQGQVLDSDLQSTQDAVVEMQGDVVPSTEKLQENVDDAQKVNLSRHSERMISQNKYQEDALNRVNLYGPLP